MSRACTIVRSVACLAAVSASPLAAQTGAISLQQRLDTEVNFSVQDGMIVQVFKQLGEATRVKFVVDPDTLEYLPYGDETRIKVTLKEIALRKALTPMLAPQALRWAIEDDHVRILPSEALYRMGRRATYDELIVLGALHKQQLQPTDKAGSVVDQLRKVTANKDLKIVYRLEGDTQKAAAAADAVLPCTGVAWLDRLGRGRDWTWYLWGDEIRVLERTRQVERQLERQASLKYQNAGIITVLLDLSRKARVGLEMDPGVIHYLPAETRTNFNLVMADATIDQALKVISGATGLKFTTTAEGIRVEASQELKDRHAATTQPRQRTPFFIRLSLPAGDGTTIDVFIRPDDLPEDIVEAVEAEKARLVQQLRDALKKRSGPAKP